MFLPVFFVLLLSKDTRLGQSYEMKLPVNTRRSDTETGVTALRSVFMNGVKALEVKFYQHRLLVQTKRGLTAH